MLEPQQCLKWEKFKKSTYRVVWAGLVSEFVNQASCWNNQYVFCCNPGVHQELVLKGKVFVLCMLHVMVRYSVTVLRVIVKFQYLWFLGFSALFQCPSPLTVILQSKPRRKSLPSGHVNNPDLYCCSVGCTSCRYLPVSGRASCPFAQSDGLSWRRRRSLATTQTQTQTFLWKLTKRHGAMAADFCK